MYLYRFMEARIFIEVMSGFFLGLGIRSDDGYLYQDSLQHGDVVMRAIADDSGLQAPGTL